MEPTRADKTSPDEPAEGLTYEGRPIEEVPIEEINMTEREVWAEGPPLPVFKRMRGECPVHWTPKITEYLSLIHI